MDPDFDSQVVGDELTDAVVIRLMDASQQPEGDVLVAGALDGEGGSDASRWAQVCSARRARAGRSQW